MANHGKTFDGVMARQAYLIAILLGVVFGFARPAQSQAKHTADRAADVQIGVGAVVAESSNSQVIPTTTLTLAGMDVYGVVDVWEHFGAEFDFRQVTANDGSHISERTYEFGGRYVRHYGRFDPYLKAMYGRGIYNYPSDVAKLAYNVYTGGAGVDIRVAEWMNVRTDFEYQTWMSFPRGNMHPAMFTVGVAYHIPSEWHGHY
jgi:hypothetical protein